MTPKGATRRRLPAIDVGHYEREGYVVVTMKAGNDGTERIVPPAGEKYAFDRELWRRRVEVSVSPTGRSVRVWVDGVEVPALAECSLEPDRIEQNTPERSN